MTDERWKEWWYLYQVGMLRTRLPAVLRLQMADEDCGWQMEDGKNGDTRTWYQVPVPTYIGYQVHCSW
jgi:hypothetical protein